MGEKQFAFGLIFDITAFDRSGNGRRREGARFRSGLHPVGSAAKKFLVQAACGPLHFPDEQGGGNAGI